MIGQTKWIARGSWCEGRDCGHRDPRPAESEFWLPAGAVGVSGAERCRGWDASCLPKTIVGGSREARSVAHLCFWHVFLSRHQATGKTWVLFFKTALAILFTFPLHFFKKVNAIYICTTGSAKTFCFHLTVCHRYLSNIYRSNSFK